MATPGYPPPPMGHMPNMGPNMGPHMQPMGMMPPRPIRRGTSKAVPVVVSAGLAVGVFCGLLFGLGTEKSEAGTEPAKGNNVKAVSGTDSTPTPGAAPAGTGSTAALPPPPNSTAISASGTAGKNPVALGSGKPVASTSSAGTAATTPAVPTVKLTIEIEPEAAASAAKIAVDGKEITGTSIDVPAGKKQVKVAIKADGFHSADKTVDLEGGDTKISFTMVKRGGGGGTVSPGFGGASSGGNHVPKEPPKLKKPPGGGGNNGIIDI